MCLTHVHRGLARHISLIAAAEHIASDVSQREVVERTFLRIANGFEASHSCGIVANVDHWFGGHFSLIATTKHVATDALHDLLLPFSINVIDMHHVDYWAFHYCAIDRPRVVISQIAAAVHVGEVKLAASFIVKHVDGDNTLDATQLVGTAKGIADLTSIEIEGNIAVDVGRNGFITSCIGIINTAFRATEHSIIDTAIEVERDVSFIIRIIDTDGSQVGAAVEFANLTHAASNGRDDVVVDGCLVGTAEHLAVNRFVITATGRQDVKVDEIDGTILVGAAIHLVNKAGIDV